MAQHGWANDMPTLMELLVTLGRSYLPFAMGRNPSELERIREHEFYPLLLARIATRIKPGDPSVEQVDSVIRKKCCIASNVAADPLAVTDFLLRLDSEGFVEHCLRLFWTWDPTRASSWRLPNPDAEPEPEKQPADGPDDLAGYQPAAWFELNHGIMHPVLSTASGEGGPVRTKPAPRGRRDSEGRRVFKLYNVEDALLHCLPKAAQV